MKLTFEMTLDDTDALPKYAERSAALFERMADVLRRELELTGIHEDGVIRAENGSITSVGGGVIRGTEGLVLTCIDKTGKTQAA